MLPKLVIKIAYLRLLIQLTWTGAITKIVTKTGYQEESTNQDMLSRCITEETGYQDMYFTIVTKTGNKDTLTRYVNRTHYKDIMKTWYEDICSEGDSKAGLKDRLKKHVINTNYSGITTKVFYVDW